MTENEEEELSSAVVYTETIINELVTTLERHYYLKIEDYGRCNRGIILYVNGHTEVIIQIAAARRGAEKEILIIFRNQRTIDSPKLLGKIDTTKLDEDFRDKMYHKIFKVAYDSIFKWWIG